MIRRSGDKIEPAQFVRNGMDLLLRIKLETQTDKSVRPSTVHSTVDFTVVGADIC